ncbi:MAG: hypothetical protein CM1200mP35_06690 [Chloroflexota bacterium]|nr:MAG: hypothetical protein CM1200mP35_06690 [Chloroflexota bacterium]
MQNYDNLFSQVDSLRDEIIDLERSMIQIPTLTQGNAHRKRNRPM